MYALWVILLMMLGAASRGSPPKELVLSIAGEELGHLEPAGCDDDMGGLGRHIALIRLLRQKHPALISLHTGNIIGTPDSNSELIYQIAIEALSYIGYELICVGPHDLALSGIQSIQSNYPSISFLCTNRSPFAKYAIQRVPFGTESIRIAFINLISQKHQISFGIKIQPPYAALRHLMGAIKDKSDLVCMVTHAPLEEVKAISP